jgi:hypothetical protein
VVSDELAVAVPAPVRTFALALGREKGAVAVLFYGSALRTDDLAGVLDFYLLTEAPHRRGLRGLVERRLWPEVSYHESGGLRAKAATLPLPTFGQAARGLRLDTTIWARFVQPAALVWARDDPTAEEVTGAVADACVTAARYAAALGPAEGPAEAFWRALFQRTYAAELRVEPPGREGQILEAWPGRYEALLPLAWAAGGLEFTASAGALRPELSHARRARLRRRWVVRAAMGKPLNLARLVKAAFTFEGAARYAAWKIERHTGVAVPLTPWRERHPLLAAPGAAWRLWRALSGGRSAR